MKFISFRELCNHLCTLISDLCYQKGAAVLHRNAFHHRYGSSKETLSKELSGSNYVKLQCFDI